MNKYLDKLEYYKILNDISTYCLTDIGKKKIETLLPENEKNKVTELLSQTDEALSIIRRFSSPSISNMFNIDNYYKLIETKSTLTAKALLNLCTVFYNAHLLKNYVPKEEAEKYPIMFSIFNTLYTNSGIVEKIRNAIIDENTISDTASDTLYSIRKKQKRLEQSIKDKLNEFIHSSKFSKCIQEPIVTIRNDRFVIPIKEEYKIQVKGFVHDISSTGSTVFIEPISVFEMNNEKNSLKLEENIEIEKILESLSSLIHPYIEEIRSDYEIIGKIDSIFAKAKYTYNSYGVIPKISERHSFSILQARHPLLDRKKAVPISITLGEDFSCLVITGPNTGGKTVALKTVGLLTCMACGGIGIPAKESSSICVFDEIFTDIGDEQSISDSLSTFSSHMTNIIEILKKASSSSLIILDELGSGTDPVEGSALAISILEKLQSIGCLVLATTHYPELKKYALVNKDFENASVEFDINTLSPTYNLLIGVPGMSNAFEIGKKLGLPNEIIQNAKSMLTSNDIHFEEILQSVYKEKNKLELEKTKLEDELQKVSLLRKSLEEKENDLINKQQNYIQKAKIQARDILLEAKENVNIAMQKLKDVSDKKDLENVRNQINSNVKQISDNIPLVSPKSSFDENYLTKEDIKIGMTVMVSSLKQKGIVLSNVSKTGDVQVQLGNMKMNINVSNLQKVSNTQTDTKRTSINSTSNVKVNRTKSVKMEINVIGQTVEEAIFSIDKFLDDCALSKLHSIYIIHGKGTGKLRQGIHNFLKGHPHVKSFRLGTFGEGEMGVTVVELK